MGPRTLLLAAVALCAALLPRAVIAQGEPGYGPLTEPERKLRFDPPAAVDQPNPWACSVQTLLDEKSCIFDSDARAGGSKAEWRKKNAAAAAALGPRLCPDLGRREGEANPDPELVKACEAAFSEASGACGRVDDRALLDGDDRFSARSAGCYAALRDVVDRVRQAADVWGGCCQCLAASGCTPSSSRCALKLASGQTDAAARSCVEGKCEVACRPVLLLTAPKKPSSAITEDDLPDPPPASGAVDL